MAFVDFETEPLDETFRKMKQGGMDIAALRSEMGLSLEAFAAQVGIASRGRMSVIERENRCGLTVALKIETLSGGRVDAAQLCEDVRAARAAFDHDHAGSASETTASAGNNAGKSPSQEAAA